MKYNLTKKMENGKWFTFGQIRDNKFGNQDCSFKITNEFLDLIEKSKEKGWLNLSCFEAKDEAPTPHQEAKANGYAPQAIDDDVPY